ncbi:ArsR/SmtB family transcription factor [Kistimonas asteriae]|uniref:ArsR/SmtB family transcription factor n=1 Tax=Kistimonas asteriae TaxID=517724 RepID=UPI001BA6AEC1|nr:metalloregulator ArsR/SmtB family transcription factor [Kistimonas asteriae]
MNDELAAKRLAELGNVTRLAIFRLLVQAGHGGLPVGDIQKTLAVPGSTLSHHISRLVSADLVRQRRDGRVLHCTARLDELQELVEFLLAECCSISH